MQEIATPDAPKAVGHYSQAVRVDHWIYCSGQISISPKTNEVLLFDGDASKQAEQILQNLATVLQAAGGGLHHVVKTTLYLTNMNDFAAINMVYAKQFAAHRPARACVQVVQLPKNVQVEIDAIAYVEE